MPGKVLRIFTCPTEGMRMKESFVIRALAGVGLEGDRYALKTGAFSESKPINVRHVTLITIEAIAEANSGLSAPFFPHNTRRNIITEGISPDELNVFVGKEFLVGAIRMRGVELAHPCARPSVLSGKPDFEKRFKNRGGLRAEILIGGYIFTQDAVRLI
jgi:hypothetical protein